MPGVLRVVPPAALDAQIQADDRLKAESAVVEPSPAASELASFIRSEFEAFRNHRDTASGWSDRLTAAMRAFKGEYDPVKLAQIREFGGSEIYARIIAMKCRGASALLRDVYLAPDRPWGVAPPDDPDVPQEIIQSIQQLIQVELQTLSAAGQPIDLAMVRDRAAQLADAARQAERKRAAKRASLAEDRMEEILNDGGFYKALAEFLVDIPLFPFACIKGPTVRIVSTVTWRGATPQIVQKPKLFWQRVSPFDLWWTPGVSDIEDAAVIERTRLTRADLNDLLDLPGYNQDAVRAVLDEYGRGGLVDNWDGTEAERAVAENRENPQQNRSGLISCLEYHGNVQGRMLLDQGMDPSYIQDPLRDYAVQAWLIGRHVIKVQLSPSPRKRHPYFITSFEKVPGTPVGNGLPDILADIQDVCNATLRSLVNNLSIASGPQVVVNDERLSAGEDGEKLFPWKRWHVTSDPMGNNTQVPISFFQPNSNAAELLGVYERFSAIADELSAIPKYQTGQGTGGGGAGRTAAGLAMLMSNASKLLQTVAANIDRDVMQPALMGLYDILLLTDQGGELHGDESIRVLGVNVAVQRETQRARQLEFLNITANPLDAGIIGPAGRAEVLRSVAKTIGLDGDSIVPSEEELAAMRQQNVAATAEAAAQAQGDQKPPSSTKDAGPRVGPGVTVAGGAG